MPSLWTMQHRHSPQQHAMQAPRRLIRRHVMRCSAAHEVLNTESQNPPTLALSPVFLWVNTLQWSGSDRSQLTVQRQVELHREAEDAAMRSLTGHSGRRQRRSAAKRSSPAEPRAQPRCALSACHRLNTDEPLEYFWPQ